MQHFYDGQIRRYITQMVRLMSNFSYKDGKGNLTQIPVMYGDLTRQVANIIRENSENKIPSAPRMAVYITGLAMDTARLADSSYINKTSFVENGFTSALGRALGYLGIGIDTSIASANEVQNAVKNQSSVKDDKKWLTEAQLNATLKASKDQAEKVLNTFKMKKEYKDKIVSKFNLK